MDHPQASVFEAFVIGALPEEDTAAFIAHVSDCDDCTKKLAAEAKTELAMEEVHAASRVRAPRVRELPRRRIWAAAGVLALAAAIALFVRNRPSSSSSTSSSTSTMTVTVSTSSASTPIPLVVCPDGLDQEKCIEDAHRHGLYVSYPPWASAPPLGGSRSGPGPSGSPFSHQQM